MAHPQLTAWLDDAYSMEQGLLPILQSHAADLDNIDPRAAARIREHILETQQHAERVKRCLQLLNETPSQVKSTLSSIVGAVEGRATRAFTDTLVKNVIADYASEQLEIACYRALATAARQLGYPEVAALCEENLRDEEAMALWLDTQLPLMVERTLTTTAP